MWKPRFNPGRWILGAIIAMAVDAQAMAAAHKLPHEAHRHSVEQCQAIGVVKANSGYGKHGAKHWQSIAKARALKKAHRMGGNHVIWTGHHARGAFNGEVTGQVYKC